MDCTKLELRFNPRLTPTLRRSQPAAVAVGRHGMMSVCSKLGGLSLLLL